MAELGELCLWAALPLAALSAVASIAGGWTGRRDLAQVGGRAAEATAVLALLGLAGLAYALVQVQLSYAYVAGNSSFRMAVPWRFAAAWSGPQGGALTLTFLISVCAAVSHRLGSSRKAAARTGSLSALAVFGLILVLVQARPFALLPIPATLGAGLPVEAQNLPWQVELWSAYLASVLAAFTFAGVTGEQLVESPGRQTAERSAAALAGVCLTVATAAAAWRAYARSGELLNAEGVAWTLMHGAAWLLVVAYLHAPGGLAVPAWSALWQRILGVALFPACVGGAAAVAAGQGITAPALPWAGGLAVGIITGAMAGVGGPKWRAPGLERVPGYGKYALLAGFSALLLAGLTAVSAFVEWGHWPRVAMIALLAVPALVVAWLIFRPAAGRRGGAGVSGGAGGARVVWPVAVAGGLGLASGIGAFALSAWRAPVFAAAVGLLAAALAGLGAELFRVVASRRLDDGVGRSAPAAAVIRTRFRRRVASMIGHLGVGVAVVGLAAGELTVTDREMLAPGETLSSSFAAGAFELTYLGLSRYQVGGLDRRVASFMLQRGQEPSSMVTVELTLDWPSGGERWRPAIQRGALGDIIIGVSGRGRDEGVVGRLAVRPLASAFWVGSGLLLLAMIGAVGSGGDRRPRDGAVEGQR